MAIICMDGGFSGRIYYNTHTPAIRQFENCFIEKLLAGNIETCQVLRWTRRHIYHNLLSTTIAGILYLIFNVDNGVCMESHTTPKTIRFIELAAIHNALYIYY